MNDQYNEYEQALFEGWLQLKLQEEEEIAFIEELTNGFYIDCSTMIH